jgi:CBS domain-containing protein
LNRPIREVLDDKGSHVETIGPDATVADAVRRMNEQHIGALLVLDGSRPVGIFTERDVLVRVVAQRRDVDTTIVRDVMTTPLVCIKPTTTVEEAMVIVTEKRCRHLPVMEGSELVGLVSIGDLTRSFIRHQQSEIQDLVSYITWG